MKLGDINTHYMIPGFYLYKVSTGPLYICSWYRACNMQYMAHIGDYTL